MTERIEWTKGKWAEEGRVNGLRLFSVGFGTTRKDDMYYLETGLPVRAPAIGQNYPTATHAKVAAERLLAAFIARLTTPPTDAPEVTR
jgi:hypothetical protein